MNAKSLFRWEQMNLRVDQSFEWDAESGGELELRRGISEESRIPEMWEICLGINYEADKNS